MDSTGCLYNIFDWLNCMLIQYFWWIQLGACTTFLMDWIVCLSNIFDGFNKVLVQHFWWIQLGACTTFLMDLTRWFYNSFDGFRWQWRRNYTMFVLLYLTSINFWNNTTFYFRSSMQKLINSSSRRSRQKERNSEHAAYIYRWKCDFCYNG